MVREFYANVLEHVDHKVFVRGRQVAFGGSAINRFLKLQDIENDEYHAFLGGKIDFHEVLQTVTVLGTQWKVTDDKPVTFPSIKLIKECKAWYYFMSA